MVFDFKKAPKRELQKRYNDIAKQIGDDKFFTGRELNYLPKVLTDGEQLLAFTSGMLGVTTWLIALTDSRIIFLNKGMIYGLKQTSIEFDKIHAISCKTGIVFGSILISEGGVQHKVEKVWNKAVLNFTNAARKAIAIRSDSDRGRSQNGSTDIASQIERLAQARQSGALSEAEFVALKNKIIG